MSIYDRRQANVNGLELSMIRSHEDLHIARNTTGEICWWDVSCQCWQEVWSGPAALAGDVLRWIVASLKEGATIEEVEDYLMEHQVS